MIEEATEIKQRFFNRHQITDRLILRLGLLLRTPDNRANTGENPNIGRTAPLRNRTLLYLPVERSHVLNLGAVREHRIGMFTGKPDAGIRRSGLKHHWLPLPGAADI